MRTNLKLFRIKVGMTQAQFAEAVGYSRNHYANVENGEQNMPMKMLENIGKRFAVPSDELMKLAKRDGE